MSGRFCHGMVWDENILIFNVGKRRRRRKNRKRKRWGETPASSCCRCLNVILHVIRSFVSAGLRSVQVPYDVTSTTSLGPSTVFTPRRLREPNYVYINVDSAQVNSVKPNNLLVLIKSYVTSMAVWKKIENYREFSPRFKAPDILLKRFCFSFPHRLGKKSYESK